MTDNSEQTNSAPKVLFWKNKTLLLIIGLPLAAYFTYKLLYPTYSWNEKMTVTVTTPDGDKTGSAVRSVTIVHTPAPLAEIGGREITLKGEAVTVNLGDGKYLFALLGAPAGWAGSIYVENIPGAAKGFADMEKWGRSLRGKGVFDIPEKSYPTLVTFKDVTDPESLEKVRFKDLSMTFGEGYELKSLTLEITNEVATLGQVEKVLGWIINRKTRLGIFEKRYIEPDDFIDWRSMQDIRGKIN